MKVQNGSEQRAFESLNEQWALLFPEIPFQGGYQVDVLSNFFRGVNIESTFMRTVAFIAVLLASLGFYGLVTLNITGRVREFSIRKVLGAGRKNIATIIVKEYMALSFLALFIGAPISYILIKANLDLLYAHPMPLDYTGVIIAVILLTLVLLLVISTQIRKVSNSNPVEGLKVE
jgi:ABC-type antimicrobial peptide transport system permease subunit